MKLNTQTLHTIVNRIEQYATAIAITLLALFFLLLVTTANQQSQTFDEGIHLAAGYSYVVRGIVQFNPEHPPLLKWLAGAAILPLQPNFPADTTGLTQTNLSRHFFYSAGNNVNELLLLGRLPTMLISVFLGWLIFVWGRQLSRPLGGLFALILYIFDPNIVTHSRYITTDIPLAAAVTATLYSLDQYRRKKNIQWLLLLCLAFAAAQLTKFSAIVLVPFVLFFLLFTKIGVKKYIVTILSIAAMTASLLLIAYAGDFSAYTYGWEKLQYHTEVGHRAYLLGQVEQFGFWYYFPVAFLVKTPPGLLVLMLISFGITIRSFIYGWLHSRKSIFRRCIDTVSSVSFAHWMLLSFSICFVAGSMIGSINIGHRHILLIYPLLAVWVGTTIVNAKKLLPALKWLVAASVLWLVVEFVVISPNYLSYFSSVVGGSSQGHHYLLDSNIDWGQNIKALAKYAKEQNIAEPITMIYFGESDPTYYRLHQQKMTGQESGWFAVSIQHMVTLPEYNHFLLREPVKVFGHGIYLYYIEPNL